MSRIYTRAGDSGKTKLATGALVSKGNPRLAACGDIDELCTVVALLREELPACCSDLAPVLEEVEQRLCDLCATFAAVQRGEPRSYLQPEDTSALECLCDKFGGELPELHSFTLPGGSRTAAQFHFARAVARRAERSIAAFLDEERDLAGLVAAELGYINRLSDLFFLLARWSLIKEGRHEVCYSAAGRKR